MTTPFGVGGGLCGCRGARGGEEEDGDGQFFHTEASAGNEAAAGERC
jgi:hypothetical protein